MNWKTFRERMYPSSSVKKVEIDNPFNPWSEYEKMATFGMFGR